MEGGLHPVLPDHPVEAGRETVFDMPTSKGAEEAIIQEIKSGGLNFEQIEQLCKQHRTSRGIFAAAVEKYSIVLTHADESLKKDEEFLAPLVERFRLGLLVLAEPKQVQNKKLRELAGATE